MFEELLISVLFIIVLIILCIISNLYSKKEEEKEKLKAHGKQLSGGYNDEKKICGYFFGAYGSVHGDNDGFFPRSFG